MQHEDEFYAALGSKVRRLRSEQRLTQEQLAEELGLNRTSVTNIEKGKQKILVHTLIDLAKTFQIEPSELLPSFQTKTTPVSKMLQKGSSQIQKDFLKSVLENRRGLGSNESSSKTHRKTR